MRDTMFDSSRGWPPPPAPAAAGMASTASLRTYEEMEFDVMLPPSSTRELLSSSFISNNSSVGHAPAAVSFPTLYIPHHLRRFDSEESYSQCSVTHFLPTFQRSLSSKGDEAEVPKRRTKVTMKPSLPSVKSLPMLPTSAHGKGLGWSTYSGQPMVGSPAKHSTYYW